jgi:pimeloyl-ACP methyl ester carboxylesterase
MKYIRKIFLSLLFLLSLLSIVTTILYFKRNTEVKTLDATARNEATGSFIQLSDGITHYELGGPDTGRLILLVHGFSVPYYIWDSTFISLVKTGFRVLRYDEFGRGYSDRPDKIYEAGLYRQQLTELLSKLNIHSVFAIAGLSFGGAVVTDFTIHNPGMVNKIILIDPVYPGDFHMTGPESWERFKAALSPEERVNGQWDDLKYPKQFPHWADQYRVQMQYKGFRHALVSTRFNYAPEGGIRENYRQLNVLHKPVMLVWGIEDKTVPFLFSDSLRSILKTEFVLVKDAAHLPQMEKPGLVNDRIISFLNQAKQTY